MRLNSARAVALFSLLCAAGCARPVDVNAPNVRGIAYVRVDDIVKAHPLYGQLGQLDTAIAALDLRAVGPVVPKTGAQIALETRKLNAQLQDAQRRANQVLRQKQIDYAQREQTAIRAATGAAASDSGGLQPVQQMQSVSAQQAQSVAQQANVDFQNYQRSVIDQDNAAIASISARLQERANRQFAQKATRLQEAESQLSLDLAQQDASQRLQLRTKLSNLAMDDAVKRRYQAQLAALDRKERDRVAAARAVDARTLSAYRAQVQAQASAAIAQQASKIRAQTQAKIASRRDVVGAQISSQIKGLTPQAAPPNLSPAARDKIAQIDKQFKEQFQADAAKTIAQYQATKADLDARYAALEGVDTAATGSAAKKAADLQKRRDDLYAKIVAQIKSDAEAQGAKRGFKVVFINVKAAAGGYDLTGDVQKDIESLRE